MKAVNRSALHKKKLGDWVINTYVGCEHGCRHCYCPAMPGVKFHNEGRTQEEWGHYLVPKHGIDDALKRELRAFTPTRARRTAWGDGWVLMSFLTDCYTPSEARHGLTRKCLTLLLEAGHRVRILTRSCLAERDFDLLSAHPGQVLFGTSVPYLDDGLARVLEPRACSPTRRLAMLERARNRGISTFAAIAPFLPGHGVEDLEAVVEHVQPLVDREVFSEVLNPKGSNVAMMTEALATAGYRDHLEALQRYTAAEWAKHTWTILTAGIELSRSWVPWPDTRKAWKNFLSPEQAQTLTGWLPAP